MTILLFVALGAIFIISMAVIWVPAIKKSRLETKEKVKADNDHKVIIALANKGSELYKFVQETVHESVDQAILSGGINYDFFKDNLAWSITEAISYDAETSGLGWLHTEVEPLITKENLRMAVASIMNMPSIDSEIAKLYVAKITNNIYEAESHERNAIEANKEFISDAGEDEELHPRIPQPGEDSDEEISEKSIEELSSTGTVEYIE